MRRAGLACKPFQISARVQSERNKSSSDFLKWDLDAVAATLGSRALGKIKGLWDGWEEKGLEAGCWVEKAAAPVRRRPLRKQN